MSAEDNREQIEQAHSATEVRTVEKQAEYRAALEHEKAGYQARLQALEDGKFDQADQARLGQLLGGVDAELARLDGKKPKKRTKKGDASA